MAPEDELPLPAALPTDGVGDTHELPAVAGMNVAQHPELFGLLKELAQGVVRTFGSNVCEVVIHDLADLEHEGYGERIRRLRDESAPRLPDFDGARLAREREYRSRSLSEGMARFAAARAANLAALRHIPDAAWGRGGSQEGVGALVLSDVPRMMAEHDRSHRQEIATLAKIHRT